MDLNPAAWDLNGEARDALQAAVASYGPAVLSNARMLNNFLTDILPDSPREAIALVAAAEADVAGMLRERVGQQLDPDSALRLTAADLSGRRAIDPAAGLWAAAEFARVLGYIAADPVPEGESAGQDTGEPVRVVAPGWSGQPPTPADAPSPGLGSEARTEPSPEASPVAVSTFTVAAGAAHNSRRIALIGFVLVALLAGGIATAASLAGGGAPHRLTSVSTSKGLTNAHNGHNISLSPSPSTTAPTTTPSTSSPSTKARSTTSLSTKARSTTAPVRSVPATSPPAPASSPASPPPSTTRPATVPPSVAVPTVPRVVGLSLAAATARLKENGYFNIPYVYSCLGSQDHGFVVTQSPGGGSPAATGTAISLRLEADNCRLVPNVRNLTLARAAGLLKSAGFGNIPYVYKCLGSDLIGEVQTQSPGPGADVVATDPVHLVLQADGCAANAVGRDGGDGTVRAGS